LITLLDEFRVTVPCIGKQYDIWKKKRSLYNTYLLKVYDDKMKLYSANGKISCNFSFDIKDIYMVKYQSKKKQYGRYFTSDEQGYLIFSINNAKSW